MEITHVIDEFRVSDQHSAFCFEVNCIHKRVPDFWATQENKDYVSGGKQGSLSAKHLGL